MAATLLAISAAIFIFALLSIVLDRSDKDRVRERLYELEDHDDIDTLYETMMRESKNKRRKKTSEVFKVSRQMEDYLAMSGIKLTANEFLYCWMALTTFPIIILLLFKLNYVTVIAGGVIGFAIPPLLVKRSRSKRSQMFGQQLGESLIVMSNCLRSGFSFQQAMESIASDMQPPISTEFARVLREMKFGVTTEDALNHMAKRVNNDELGLLISAILTSTQVGANLTEILDICSSTIKDRLKIKDDIRVMSTQGRMSGMVLGALPIFIVLMLMLINPNYILGFFAEQTGKILICVGVVMEIIGFLFIRKIVSVKY